MALFGLRVDVDSYDGALEGVPALIALFARLEVRATFFVSVGPDRWGLAALRAFTKKGFFAKAMRTRGLYPTRTMLRGTLLPARHVSELAPLLREIEVAGHEVGLHAWDHVRWQDALPRMTPHEVRDELAQGFAAFERVYGKRPRSIAAPGWVCSDEHLLAQDALGLDYASDGRGTEPFVARVGETELATVQVATTLPTVDELLGLDGTTAETINEKILAAAPGGRDEVYVLHTEVEGRGFLGPFERLVNAFRERGYEPCPLERIARAASARRAELPRRRLVGKTVPGRSGLVGVVA
ncbi:MAG: polysaccharide deacetylase family protein [Planctomycetota bacterium]